MALVAKSAGTSEEEMTEVIKGMIISSKNQHGAQATNAELAVFTGTCAKYGLNPLTKEAHAFVSGGKLQIIVGVDGWNRIALRQDDYDGVEFEDNFDKDGKVISMTCKIYSKSRSRPTVVTERMDECNDPKSSVWKKFPHRMLRHKAFIQCCRMAFGISEVIDDDEVNRIKSNQPRDITPAQQGPTTEEIDLIMAECGDLETLKQACGELRVEMQNNGTWKARSAEVIALNVKHKDRINSYVDAEIDTDTPQGISEANEAIEGELMPEDDNEPDIGFGEDDTDEFGETKQ